MLAAMDRATAQPAPEPRGLWTAEFTHVARRLCEALDYTPLTPDIDFVAFLRVHSQFGFFRFGPITIDVNVLEEILLRTHPRGEGGPAHPPPSPEFIRLGAFSWQRMKARESPFDDELQLLRAYMEWGGGLPARVFGELGVTVEDLDNYVAELAAGGASSTSVGSRKLYSTEEAARYLGVHVQTVRAWIRSGKLPASRLAGLKSIRIRERDLEAVLEPIDPTQLDD